MKVKKDWHKINTTKAQKLLEKTKDDLSALHDKLFQLNYLAHSNNDPVLSKKISNLQGLMHQAYDILKE